MNRTVQVSRFTDSFGTDGSRYCSISLKICQGNVAINVPDIEICTEDMERLARAFDGANYTHTFLDGGEICSHIDHFGDECACKEREE